MDWGVYKFNLTIDVKTPCFWGGNLQVFEVFEEKPLGSASIAQVQGVLLGGMWMLPSKWPESQRRSTMFLRLFQHTELEHTPSNLYQQAIMGFLS